MCFPKPPKPTPLPKTPQPDDDLIRQREQRERAFLQATSGTAATVKTDLDPSSLAGQRRVLLGV